MKRLILAGFVLLGTLGVLQIAPPEAAAEPVDCSRVFCAPCPEGQVLDPVSYNCCRCRKI